MNSRSPNSRLGLLILAALLAITAVELWVASQAEGPVVPYPVLCGLLAPLTWLAQAAAAAPLPILLVLALGKASLILYYFMHVSQLWRPEEEKP